LLARLAIEEVLQFEGVATAVSGNQILLQGPRAFSLIEVQASAAGRLQVQIRSFLGVVLLKDDARGYVESFREEAAPVEVSLSADGVVQLAWRQEFGPVVDPVVVVAALNQILALMVTMLTPLLEEYYLRPIDPRRVREAAGGAQ
jgi:hypothetical protein